MMLRRAEVSRAGRVHRFMLCDSSPQAGYDWLWCQYKEVQHNMLTSICRASHSLAADIERFCEDEISIHGDSWVPAPSPLPGWQPHLRVIGHGITEHICPPMALASGQSSLPHKARAVLHAWFLESPCDGLDNCADSIQCVCSDLGVEVGLADFHCTSLHSLLPEWLREEEQLQPDIDAGGESSVDEGGELMIDVQTDNANAVPTVRAERTFFLQNALPVYGTQHCVNNATQAVHQGMQWWETFHQHLKRIEGLLERDERRERFVNSCILAVPSLADKAPAFRSFSADLYDKRWKAVCLFVKVLVPLLPLLRQAWDANRYILSVDGDGPAKDAAFSPADLTETFRCNLFYRYVDFVIQTETVPSDALGAWCEGCNCHEPLLLHLSDHRRHAMMGQHYDKSVTACPMSGMRADLMAAGHLDDVFAMCWKSLEEHVLVGPSSGWYPLGRDDMLVLQADMERARGLLDLELRTKFHYWKCLPWKLCGLAHRSEAVARRLAVHALAMFLECPQQQAHHRVTWSLLRDGAPFRAGMDEFIAGKSRWLCGSAFTAQIGMFRLFPIAETTVESRHARVSLDEKKHPIGPVRVSLSNRMSMMEKKITHDPSYVQRLVEQFVTTRSMVNIAPALGLQRHPQLDGAPRHHSSLRVLLGKVVYNCDLEFRFLSMKAEMKIQEQYKRKLGEADKRFCDEKVAVTEQSILRDVMLAHLRERLDLSGPSLVFSVPRGSFSSMQALQDVLDKPRAKARRGPALLEPEPFGADDAFDVETCKEAETAGDIFFSIVSLVPANRKTIRVDVGTGGTLSQESIAIAKHTCLETHLHFPGSFQARAAAC